MCVIVCLFACVCVQEAKADADHLEALYLKLLEMDPNREVKHKSAAARMHGSPDTKLMMLSHKRAAVCMRVIAHDIYLAMRNAAEYVSERSLT